VIACVFDESFHASPGIRRRELRALKPAPII
jgi:hypothetical protein